MNTLRSKTDVLAHISEALTPLVKFSPIGRFGAKYRNRNNVAERVDFAYRVTVNNFDGVIQMIANKS